jgi:hypothetical protein
MDSALLTCVLRLVIVQVKYCVEKVTLPDLFRQSVSVASWTKCGALSNSSASIAVLLARADSCFMEPGRQRAHKVPCE